MENKQDVKVTLRYPKRIEDENGPIATNNQAVNVNNPSR